MRNILFIRYEVNISRPMGKKMMPQDSFSVWTKTLWKSANSEAANPICVCFLFYCRSLPDSCSWGISSANWIHAPYLWAMCCIDTVLMSKVYYTLAYGNNSKLYSALESRRMVGERCDEAICRSSVIHSFCFPTWRASKSNRTSCAPFH